MPRVSINKEKYLMKDLREWMIGRMKTCHQTQVKMGEILKISHAAFGQRLSRSNFTYSQFLEIFKELDAMISNMVVW